MNAEKNVQKERMGRGVQGALLGALLGGAVIVLEDRTAGTFSPVFAAAAAIAVFQGYRQLAGGLSKRGAAICVIVLMAVIAGANQINCTMEVIETVDALRGRDFVEVFGAFEEIPEVREIQSWYQGHLLVLYLFCLLGSLPILVRAFRKPRARTKAELEEILLGKEQEDPEQEKPELQGTLYPFRKAWMKPVRISAGGAAVALLAALVVLMMLMPRLEERFEIRLEFGMIAGICPPFSCKQGRDTAVFSRIPSPEICSGRVDQRTERIKAITNQPRMP